jgi:DNA (cytosine-5)-methyltransferase 1
MHELRYGSLFTGIGGLDLGLDMAGFECAWQVEVDEFCKEILEREWPNAKRYGDVFNLDTSKLESVDLICGGFPCQPVSVAGKRSGTSDERWLWPEFARIIREIKPRWVVAENVPGLLSANSGRAFAEVLRDLAESGYDAVWDIFPAGGPGGSGALHKRERIFIIGRLADSKCNSKRATHRSNGRNSGEGRDEQSVSEGSKVRGNSGNSSQCERDVADSESINSNERQHKISREANTESGLRSETRASGEDVADPNSPRQQQGDQKMEGRTSKQSDGSSVQPEQDVSNTDVSRLQGRISNRKSDSKGRQESSEGRPTKRSFGWEGSGDYIWTTEPDVGRVAHGIPKRIHRLKALGNAVVPQVAKKVGEMIMELENG